ncbi:hypothetical protein UPYG_G00193160 [Umbra pygmaea]|uniref:Uncharacterized protein n=1 Tax=Umbra pygmaea TaxID=75934 RepID=A0ABD0WGK8_UMBPY
MSTIKGHLAVCSIKACMQVKCHKMSDNAAVYRVDRRGWDEGCRSVFLHCGPQAHPLIRPSLIHRINQRFPNCESGYVVSTDLTHWRLRKQYYLWEPRACREQPSGIYSHVRKLSLSILVAASTDSMSFRMSELSASWRLGISSSPSTAMLSLSRVPRSTSVPGMASR